MEFLERRQKESNPDVGCSCSRCQKWKQLSVASHAAVREGLKTKLFEHHEITPKWSSGYVHKDFFANKQIKMSPLSHSEAWKEHAKIK